MVENMCVKNGKWLGDCSFRLLEVVVINVKWKIRDSIDRTSAGSGGHRWLVIKDNLVAKLFINIVDRIKIGDLSLMPRAHLKVEEDNGLQPSCSLGSIYHYICTVVTPPHTHENKSNKIFLKISPRQRNALGLKTAESCFWDRGPKERDVCKKKKNAAEAECVEWLQWLCGGACYKAGQERRWRLISHNFHLFPPSDVCPFTALSHHDPEEL